MTIDEANLKPLNGLKKSVKTFVSNLITKYKAHAKHIERLVQEESMVKELPESLKTSLESLISTRAPYSRTTQKKAFADKSI